MRGSLINEQENGEEDSADAPADGDEKKDDDENAAEAVETDESTARDDYQLARALDLLRGLQLLSSTVVN